VALQANTEPRLFVGYLTVHNLDSNQPSVSYLTHYLMAEFKPLSKQLLAIQHMTA